MTIYIVRSMVEQTPVVVDASTNEIVILPHNETGTEEEDSEEER